MFDNVAFNVVLGLVLVYLLYSLLVTILGEMLATWLGLRSRILRLAIERMLNDGYYKTQHKRGSSTQTAELGWWQRLFLKESSSFRHSFAGRFYAYPSIKYLAKLEKDQQGLFGQTKPAYISDKNFADTLIHMLSDKGHGHNILRRIHFSLAFNTYHIQPETIKHLKNLLENSGYDLNVFRFNLEQWFNETMDRTNGWYKNKLRIILFLLGMMIAAAFNVDSIGVAGILANDKEARNQLVNMGVALTKDSSAKYYSNPVLDTGLSRVNKDISSANLILGLGWDCSKLSRPQIDTIWKTGKDDDFDKIRDKVVQFEQYEHHALSSSLTDSLASRYAAISVQLDSLHRNNRRLRYDTIRNRLDQATIDPKDRLAKRQSQTAQQSLTDSLASIARQIKLDSAVWALDSFNLYLARKDIRNTLRFIDTTLGTEFRTIDSVSTLADSSAIVISGTRAYTTFETVIFAIKHIFRPGKLAGFLLTAIALSLGAPFWFDLLSKLVSLRGSGVKPEDKAPPENKVQLPDDPIVQTVAPAAPPIIADPIDQVLATHGDALRGIPGVKSLFKRFDPANRTSQLQINVADDATAAVVRGKVPVLFVNATPIAWTIVVSGTPVPHVSGMPGEIANASGLNGSGSLGCVLLDTDTNKKHILSCWHVLKGNTAYDDPDSLLSIIDAQSQPLANRWAGGIKGCFDFGMAELLPGTMAMTNGVIFNPLHLTKVTWKPLTNADINSKGAVKFMNCFNSQDPKGLQTNGIILCDTPSVEIHYEDKVRIVEDVLVLTDNSTGTETSISQDGNSGALVFDAKGVAIAMIIAGDAKYTYAMKLSNFFSLYKEMKIV